ncbi:hypothetical protein HPP92_023815 [Vanilla planifolia]|uniref:Uncharacterized protein n=1 Tax=Vanilla planifolia TaxID=51239 RepID=A0A835UAV5_VANPL|nr:hypothetical protein HPP92_023815 [Vanilla planifolia]
MLGATLQIARGHGDERFYNPARARWSYYQHHQDVIRSRSCGSPAFSSIPPLVSVEKAELSECAESGEGVSNSETCTSSSDASVCSSLEPESVPCSNLDRFLESTTPSVPVQYVAKRTMRGRRICDVEYTPYFSLGDLWDSFKEWSAYGAGVPLVLNGSDSVVQYYVPYLSGIQLYNQPCERSVSSRCKLGEDISCNSVGITDYKSDKLLNLKGCSQKAFMFHRNGFSFRCNRITMTNGFSRDSSEVWNPEGTVLFEFLEQDSPYNREPLANKVSDLIANFPGLKALRSCDLSPSSWFSVAWYPIYRIPTGPTLKRS